MLATVQQLWPLSFLLCSVAAALTVTAARHENVSPSSYMGGRRGRRRVVRRPRLVMEWRADIEGLAFPRELKEWVYPTQ
jgi:hypothetical protein